MSPLCVPCLLALSIAFAVPALASPADLCRDAARKAAAETGVPLRILIALSLTETGRKDMVDGGLEPWPWALNHAGTGQWFETRDQTLHALDDILAAGATNVDLGCFQLNWRWHAAAFPSAAAMLDPEANAAYAARFLADLHGRTGDWRAAVAAYHSATPERAEIYLARFDPIYDALDESRPTVELAEAATRENAFPLLRAGTTLTPASLVPMSAAARPLFGG